MFEDDYYATPPQNDYEDEQQILGSYRDVERTGGFGTMIEGRGDLVNAQQKLRTNEERVVDQLGIYLAQFVEDHVLSAEQAVYVRDVFSRVPYLEYKNPYVFILGYITLRGKEIAYLEKAIELLHYSGMDNIAPPDIIRYARLWISLI
jgi:hypothetical protein